MPSDRKAEASRRNGAKSRGPKTNLGKARSSKNARKHNFTSKDVVLTTEEEPAYNALAEAYIARFAPADAVEMTAVKTLIAAAWRLERVWRAETSLISLEIARNRNYLGYFPEDSDSLTMTERTAFACRDYAQSTTYSRYEPFFRRSWERALRSLAGLQGDRRKLQNEPEERKEATVLQQLRLDKNEPDTTGGDARDSKQAA